jgi:hypothetical protein
MRHVHRQQHSHHITQTRVKFNRGWLPSPACYIRRLLSLPHATRTCTPVLAKQTKPKITTNHPVLYVVVVQDLIISEDPKLGQILQRIDQGDKSAVVSLRESGALDRRQSIDILADMGDSFDFLGVGAHSPSLRYVAHPY